MKVVHVSFSYDDSIRSEDELVEQHYTVTGWAEALQRKGIEVIVANRFYKDSSLVKNNVQYYFYKDRFGNNLRGWQVPFQFFKLIKVINPDVVHLHNLTLSIQTFFFRQILEKDTAILVQHHGGIMPEQGKRRIHNLFNKVANGFFFTTVEQGKEWFMNNISVQKLFPVMEGATFFNIKDRDRSRNDNYINREQARKETAMTGSPIFLWVGRLDDNKDPLTVLNGFEEILRQHPTAQLYLIYSDDKLSGKLLKRLNSSETLKSKVHLIGKVAHHEIEKFYNSADYFVLGSHYEGSGYALSEAIRCGCIPIVTNIPSFRMMTNEGKLGALWQPGNSKSFAEAATSAFNKSIETEANACINFYENNLSFDAIAATAMEHYATLTRRLSKTDR